MSLHIDLADTILCTYTGYRLNLSTGTDANENTFLTNVRFATANGSVDKKDEQGIYNCNVTTTMVI